MPETVSRLGSLKRAALGIPTLFNSAALIWWMRASVKKTLLKIQLCSRLKKTTKTCLKFRDETETETSLQIPRPRPRLET